ncbi:hypothetical protein C3B44_08335 [Corynebacterium yudongzhengii]|uniref:Helicase XPB/Ssl2 N-terminal domain-containing protein n=1 Tax=Corynebacterium yudongzhengii TaxID=2080740 RepID=A0A2U1T7N8_9CORY|nr:hypothetical protein [Corynebacterium yudongzhengii]AWB82361.1 hypothetical protein C3B44_08335 [Corynebacterium yudongzhengii]PWC02020.1 hypothetical protein DF222_04040 [Corynebacterium yudongzhengii]
MTSSPSDSYLSWLRGLGAEQLATLLRHRPDVVLPPPPGPRPLAKRLQLRSSVARALRSATALELATIEVAADLGAELSAISPEALTNTIVQRAQARDDTLADDEVTASVAKLTQLGLLYPTETGWRLVTEAMSALPWSFGLLPATPATQIQSRLNDLEPAQLHLLQSLARSGGIGHSRSAGVDAEPAHPIPQLINAGLLERLDASHVRLPRTIARVLTGTPTHHLPLVRPLPHPAPASDAAQKAIDRVDTAGIAQGLEITRQVVELIDALGTQPIALNKDSSVPARATGQLARRLGYSPEEIKLLVAIAQSAGLLGTGLTGQVPEPLDPEANYLAPTRDVDDWLAGDLPARYARLLTGWLRSPHAHFHGGRLLDNDEVREALPELRRVALALYTHLPADRPLAAEDIASHLGFYAPLVATGAAHHDVGALIDEAHTLGALAHGAATTVVRELISGADPVATVAAHTRRRSSSSSSRRI